MSCIKYLKFIYFPFPAGRNIAVAHDRRASQGRQPGPQRNDGGADLIVLPIGESRGLIAFDFDAHRVVVAVGLPSELRLSRMPGALKDAHELNELAVAAHQKMR